MATPGAIHASRMRTPPALPMATGAPQTEPQAGNITQQDDNNVEPEAATSSSSTEAALVPKDTGGYETYYPNIEEYLLGQRTDPPPLFKCIICHEELMVWIDEDSLEKHCVDEALGSRFKFGPLPEDAEHARRLAEIYPNDPDIVKKCPPPVYSKESQRRLERRDAAWCRATERARTALAQPLPLTGRETDNSHTLQCCRNIIGVRCLMAMSVEAMRNGIKSLRCPFCRVKLKDLIWPKLEAQGRGMCILCLEFPAGYLPPPPPEKGRALKPPSSGVTVFEKTTHGSGLITDDDHDRDHSDLSLPRETYTLQCNSNKSGMYMPMPFTNIFCLVCIDEWIRTCPRTGGHQHNSPFCPTCQTPIGNTDIIGVRARMAELGTCPCCRDKMVPTGTTAAASPPPPAGPLKEAYTLTGGACSHRVCLDCLINHVATTTGTNTTTKITTLTPRALFRLSPISCPLCKTAEITLHDLTYITHASALQTHARTKPSCQALQGYYYRAPHLVLALWTLAQPWALARAGHLLSLAWDIYWTHQPILPLPLDILIWHVIAVLALQMIVFGEDDDDDDDDDQAGRDDREEREDFWEGDDEYYWEHHEEHEKRWDEEEEEDDDDDEPDWQDHCFALVGKVREFVVNLVWYLLDDVWDKFFVGGDEKDDANHDDDPFVNRREEIAVFVLRVLGPLADLLRGPTAGPLLYRAG